MVTLRTHRDNVEWHNGRNAKLAGELPSANPYPLSADPDSRHMRWALGYDETPAVNALLTCSVDDVVDAIVSAQAATGAGVKVTIDGVDWLVI